MKFRLLKVGIFALLSMSVFVSCGKSSSTPSGTPTLFRTVDAGEPFLGLADSNSPAFNETAVCMQFVNFMSGSTINGSQLWISNVTPGQACPTTLMTSPAIQLSVPANQNGPWNISPVNSTKVCGQIVDPGTGGDLSLQGLGQFASPAYSCTVTLNSNGTIQQVQ